MKPFLPRAIGVVLRFRGAVIAASLGLTLALGGQAAGLRLVMQLDSLFPQDDPSVVASDLSEEIFGSHDVAVLGLSAVDGSSVYRRDVLSALESLTRELRQIPGVEPATIESVAARKVKSITGRDGELDVEPLLEKPITPESIESLRSRYSQNPIYQGTLISEDETVAAIAFSVDPGAGGERQILGAVEAAAERVVPPQVRFAISGEPAFVSSIEQMAGRMGFLFPLAVIVIGLIHWEAFRTAQGLLLPLVTSLLAVVWSLGIMGATGVPLDAFNAATPILILAVAAGHAVQLLKRYYEEFERVSAADPRASAAERNDRAIVQSLSRIAPVMLTAGGVAAAGFFSLQMVRLETIQNFGLITGVGILCILLIELTLIPAVRSYLPPPRIAPQASSRLWDRLAAGATRVLIRGRRPILVGFGALAAICSLGFGALDWENSTKSYFGESLDIRRDDRFLNEKLAGTNTLEVIFRGGEPDRMKDPEILEVILDTQRFVERLPDVGKTLSIADFLLQIDGVMRGSAAEAARIPESRDLISQYLFLYSLAGDPTDLAPYIDYEYRSVRLLAWMKDDRSLYAAEMLDSIREFLRERLPEDVEAQIGGSVPRSAALAQIIVGGKIENIAVIVAIVFLFGTVVFRSAVAGLCLITPLAMTVMVGFGVMGLTGIPFNIPNSVSSAMAVGIGADYCIYLLYRIREELTAAGGDLDAAIGESMRTAGKAILYVASAIGFGYSVLILSFGFHVHVWSGILIPLSMWVSAFSSLILVPTLLRVFEPSFLGAIASPGTGRLTEETIR